MQASSTSRVHQTHSATRVTTGVEERETRQRVRKRARTRVRKHSHTPTPLAHGGKHTGGRLTATSHRGCAAQEPAAPLSMQGRHEHRQKPAAARGRGRARAREPGELTRGASAELFCARKTFVAALVLEHREQHRRKGLRGQNDVARRKRPLRDDAHTTPWAARRRNLEPLVEVPLARIVPLRREGPDIGRAPCAHRAAACAPEQRERQGGRGPARDR